MYLQEIFEVVIGLVFTWLVLSTATMQVQEWIANLLRWRASDLENTLKRMLNDEDFTRLFYEHPLICSLSGEKDSKNPKPSYIPANKFSAVLLNIIQNAETESSLLLHGLYGLFSRLGDIKDKSMRQQADTELSRLVELARLSASSEGGEALGNLMLTSLEKEINDFGERFTEVKEASKAVLEKVQANKDHIDKMLKSLPVSSAAPSEVNKTLRGMLALGVTNPGLRLTLSSLLVGAEDQAGAGASTTQTLRTNIKSWFNDSMDRLTGWYKRKAQLTAFILGCIIAAVLNVDTINISNQLWREPVVRQAINANANQILERAGGTTPPSITDLVFTVQDQFLNISLPIGWTFESDNSALAQNCSFVPGRGAVFGLNWYGSCVRPTGALPSTNGWIWSVTKLAGLLMTGLAATQGSSFWFDVLMKIINVRGSGIKPV